MTCEETVRKKLLRLRAGGKPRVLDLFAGCGGLSLGFQAAGFTLKGAVEFDPDAARSHGLNFHGGDPRHSKARDITQISPDEFTAELELGPAADAFDVIVGGPPCQAFARVGRPKLREIDAHPQAFRHDPRARLYQEYLRWVDVIRPLAVLIENVPDVLNHGGQNIAEEICEVLEEKGYTCGYTLLNAVFFGVPQMRERMFLIALRREIDQQVQFPQPTNWAILPPGYEGSRAVALKVLNGLIGEAHDYIEPPAVLPTLPAAVSAEQALHDLPPIFARQQLASGELKRGARRFDLALPYPGMQKLSAYARMMREWPGFEAPQEGLKDHVIRYLPRDYELFARLNPGDQYPQAHEHALAMLEERIALLRRKGQKVQEGSAEYKRLKDSIVPPYDASKFPNKWRKMWRDQPARTLMAHLGKDSYSHIHYDSGQARTISVREAARLQSFPDGFVFCGTMNPAFRQIGNAVPPLMARALATTIMTALRGQEAQDNHVSRHAAAAV
ncbi:MULTISPECIES: DNA cytosine methyltransferase [unclassified Azospirillum]|uniref:DNA cytosine methyltransferase n=1 Tax=unclassified Azospirillum TaxID=2630922 RepID=UPI000B7397BA|nr:MULTISPECIES: DNA cytosine methyltransferase [unclassified Azospirillum]SNT21680.1 DNA (cytosine-5)-methyltransferase 1 [Azospirillum sp. RU38E]SNT33223.1 DNA (cytosine-5)-methyltransferase 1 [Azospirillum sp. RU37A]